MQKMDYEEDIMENDDFEENINDKYLSFKLGDEFYGVNIKHVSEIIELQKISPVPETPHYVKGVINLRGKIIPVVDLRLKFRMPEREYDDRTCIVLIRIDGVDTGLIVDTVNEVLDIPEQSIDFTENSNEGNIGNVMGIGKKNDTVVILIHAEKLINNIELKGFYQT
jgi:purine-binding chemotaxis protein CheW